MDEKSTVNSHINAINVTVKNVCWTVNLFLFRHNSYFILYEL